MPSCPRIWEVDATREQRLSPKDAEAFDRHVRACNECTRRAERNDRLRELASALSEPPIDALALRRIRGRVLRAVATMGAPSSSATRALTLRIGAIVVAAAACLTVAWAFHAGRPLAAHSLMAPSPGSGAFASTILATEGAKWSRERVGSTETVRLSDGELRIHVRHQLTEERFVVVLPDGELEVRGTTFDVRVERGSTSIVRVEEGRVALRMAGRAERLLGGGESWSAQPPAVAAHASVAGATAAADHSSRRNGPLHAGAPAPRTPVAADDAAHAYAAALGLLSARQFGPSATAFHDFVAAHPNAPQAEDASFLEAVALARAGRADAAALVAERHLQAYPESFHGKDAAILVARSARDRGDCPKVRAVLAAALDARDGAALAAAGACAYTYRASASDGGGRALPSR